MSEELVGVIQTYRWQCMECKTCTVCQQPHHEDEMMFCDKCDRGYHTFCVGMDSIPTGECMDTCRHNVWWADTERQKQTCTHRISVTVIPLLWLLFKTWLCIFVCLFLKCFNGFYPSPQAFGYVRSATKISPHPRRREEPKHRRSPSQRKNDQQHH